MTPEDIDRIITNLEDGHIEQENITNALNLLKRVISLPAGYAIARNAQDEPKEEYWAWSLLSDEENEEFYEGVKDGDSLEEVLEEVLP